MRRLLFLLVTSLSIELSSGRQVPDFAAAGLVLGQSDFTTANMPVPPSASSLDHPSGVAVDAATGKVFVADTGNNRVLRYANAGALQNGASAEAAFGQPDRATHTAASTAANSLDSPTALWIDTSGRLWVSDTGNNRVVMYSNAASAGDGPDAALILGQPDASTTTLLNPPSAASMGNPQGICIDPAGRLWVADMGNNRVLRFDGAAGNTTGSPQAAADGEFGQDQGAPFTSNASGSDNLHFMGPSGVAVDGNGTLWVSDHGNNRIMGFPSAATISNGANGARILGQPDYNAGSTTAGVSASAISGPTGMYIDAQGSLWLLDQGNNRALRFANISSIDNCRPASSVIGQADFASNTTGLDAQRLDTQNASIPSGLFVQADGTLWITDLNHSRVLRYATADSAPPTISIKGKPKVTSTKSRMLVRGTASDDTGVTQVVLMIGHKSLSAAGTTTWKRTIPLKKSRTVIKAYAYDASGKISAPAKVVIVYRPATSTR